jgi:two-component system LytT family response regulator
MIRTIIIDDEEKSRKLLANMLKLYCENIEVLAFADSVDSGLAVIQKHQPDLIFLDIIMPGEDGFSLLTMENTQ